MVDDSSLASTEQLRDFLRRISKEDKVLLIGDVRQHQGVEAGKPFEQLQHSGMQTAMLDRIVRQKDPELLRAVEHLSKNETEAGVRMLQQQGRVTEITDPEQRIAAIAKAYSAHPENTIIVSPDNASRRAINQAVRQELQSLGTLDVEDRSIKVLTPRSDMTGADRAWAARYQTGDVLHYIRGSKEYGIEGGSYAEVVAATPRDNLVTVRRSDGELVNGELDCKLDLPTRKVTSLTFGGDQSRDLYITTAGGNAKRNNGLAAGSLLCIKSLAQGVPEFLSRIQLTGKGP